MTSSHPRAAFRCIVILGLFAIAASNAHAVPRLSLVSGTRCSACHFNPQGGGLRTELGWESMNDVSAWRWPWSPKRQGLDDSGDDNLFNAPSDNAMGSTPFEQTPDDTTSAAPIDELPPEDISTDESSSDTDVVEDFEAGEPLPAHEPTEVVEESTVDVAPLPEAGDNAMSAADIDEVPSAPIEIHTNTLFDGLITPGFDLRLQMTKLGRPPADTRIVIPMQSQFYLAITPADWVSLYGSVNASAIKFSDSLTVRRYPSQSAWEATAQFHPGVTLPMVRVGYMQPSIGIRHDDHTSFTRRDVAGSSPLNLVPPGYAELGVEAHYDGVSWLTVNAGIFSSSNLSAIEPALGEQTSLADFSNPAVLARVMLWPQDLDLGFNGELGASLYSAGGFGDSALRMINIFAGLGLSDRGSFLVEALMADYPGERSVRNVSVMGSYQLFTWMSLNWRYEWAQSEDPSTADPDNAELAHAQQAVFGLEFFPFPNVELRPEYRFFQTEPFAQVAGYLQGQYTLQLHLYY